MIAARQIFLGRGGGAKVPTARDYVQTGLVAMWDGIENAGWGVHDSSATTWTELVSGTSVDISAYGAFTENAFSSSARMISILGTTSMKNAIGSSVFTAEFVFSSASVNAGIYMWGNPLAFQLVTLSDYAVRFISGGTIISQTAAGVGQSTGSYGLARNGLQATAYYGGQQLGNETTCAAIGMPTANLDIPASRILHSIRIHSRALTAAEIAANYTIDKARFNLP